MKTKITIVIQSILLLVVTTVFSQNPPSQVHGGEVVIPRNTEPCLTDTQRNAIIAENQANITQLRAQGIYQEPNEAGSHPLFIWPVAQAPGYNYNITYSLANYVDHNTAFPNQVSDYDCGTRTYDTANGYNHKGFDIISWPFWWKQMDRNQAINVAAADGQIINKNDGSFDRNCSFNNDTPNFVAVQHNDGSQTWYLHMKDGELTSKNIGDSVTAGEFLGVIGSSGSSTAPHLHFEVYDSTGALIDPSIGACNTLNNETWWIDQKPYWEPAINAAITQTDFPNFETCPNSEITNESNEFDLIDTIFYGIYLKDQRAGTQLNLKTIRPDGTVQFDWDFNLTDNLLLSHWIWSFPADMEGAWTWQATYLGETVNHTYYVGVLAVEENDLTNTFIYPNPARDAFSIKSDQLISKVALRDIMGRTVFELSSQKRSLDRITLNDLAEGMYFVTLTSEENQQKTIQLIKN